MQTMLRSKEGRQKHKIRSAKDMQKLLSTSEGKEKHNRRSAEGMQTLVSTEEETYVKICSGYKNDT